MRLTSVLVGASLALLPMAAAHADTVFTGNLGYEMGGDEVVEVAYTDGSSESINGGDGFFLNVGSLTELTNEGDWQLGFSVGFKYRGIIASNGDISLVRFPLEATIYKDLNEHRFGVGAVYHSGITLDGSGEGSWVNDYSDDLTSHVGLAVQYGYSFNPYWSLGLRYTSIKYASSSLDKDIDASSGGLIVSARF